MATPVSICNRALSHCNIAHRIESLEADDDPIAEACNLAFEPAIHALLRQHDWQFARRTAALAAVDMDDEGIPVYWDYKYAYPANCLRLHKVVPEKSHPTLESADFAIESDVSGTMRVIVTNLENAYAIYTAKVDPLAYGDPLFEEALVWAVARELAPDLTGNETVIGYTERRYAQALSAAWATDFNEQKQSNKPMPRTVRVRRA